MQLGRLGNLPGIGADADAICSLLVHSESGEWDHQELPDRRVLLSSGSRFGQPEDTSDATVGISVKRDQEVITAQYKSEAATNHSKSFEGPKESFA